MLSETADGIRKGELPEGMEFTDEEHLAIKRARVHQALEAMKTPTDSELMMAAIDDLKQFSNISSTDAIRALVELEYLVEIIDNANVMEEMGGLSAVFDILEWYGIGQLAEGYCPSSVSLGKAHVILAAISCPYLPRRFR